MLSIELHEAVKSGFVDLEGMSFMDVYRGGKLRDEDKALASALLSKNKAFVRDPKGVADPEAIRQMVYRGVRQVKPALAAAFGSVRIVAGRAMYPDDDLARFITVKRVTGRTGGGWKITANVERAAMTLGVKALERGLKGRKLLRRVGSEERREVKPGEFGLMAPTPVKGKGGRWWQFKHHDTRNYVYVNAETGVLWVPTEKKAFHQGEFG